MTRPLTLLVCAVRYLAEHLQKQMFDFLFVSKTSCYSMHSRGLLHCCTASKTIKETITNSSHAHASPVEAIADEPKLLTIFLYLPLSMHHEPNKSIFEKLRVAQKDHRSRWEHFMRRMDWQKQNWTTTTEEHELHTAVTPCSCACLCMYTARCAQWVWVEVWVRTRRNAVETSKNTTNFVWEEMGH